MSIESARGTQLTAFPKVAPITDGVRITVTPSDGADGVRANAPYDLRWFSMVNRQHDVGWSGRADGNGGFSTALRFASPGEYRLTISQPGSDTPLRTEHFFCVDDDRAPLRPFKGDMHVHTTHSDGRASPLQMVRQGRAIGLDFLTFADHDVLDANLPTIEQCARLGIDMLLLPGEEVSLRGPRGHVIAFGPHRDIRLQIKDVDYDAEIAALARTLRKRTLVSPLTAEAYAHVLWAAQHIRQDGVLLILAHPYWVGTTGKYFPPRCVVDQLLADGLVDAVELQGGSPSNEDNHLAVARHYELALTGRRLPVVGGSDAHGLDELGRKFTLLFAPELTHETLRAGILQHRTVACSQEENGDVGVFGPFPLVEYAYFLLREYFPAHDTLCQEQAQLYTTTPNIEPAPLAPQHARLRNSLTALQRHFWL
jgi:hypothetical protein